MKINGERASSQAAIPRSRSARIFRSNVYIPITNRARDLVSCCLLLREHHAASSTYLGPGIEPLRNGTIKCDSADMYQREISFHSTEEALSVLLWTDNSRLSLVSTSAEECGILHPTLQFLVPSVCSDVICRWVEQPI